MEIEDIFGLPAHPLLVHAPVVLLPLGALGVLLMVIRVAWFERFKWATLAVVGAGTLGAVLAAGSGESLQEETRRRVGDHAEAGDAARAVSIVFFVVVLVAVLLPVLLKRRAAARASAGEGTPQPGATNAQPLWLRILVTLALVASATASVITVVNAGHSGAERVWENEGERSDRGERPSDGYRGDDDDDD